MSTSALRVLASQTRNESVATQKHINELRSLPLTLLPRLVPWHLPQWLYDPRALTIFYPDLQDLPEETLSLQAALLGRDDLQTLHALVEEQAPAVMAHELFHHFRDYSRRLTDDAWLEELAANALSVAYCREFEPAALARGLAFARAVLDRPENALSPAAETILQDLRNPTREQRSADYGVDLHQSALVQLAMIEHLAQNSDSLASSRARYLTPPARASE